MALPASHVRFALDVAPQFAVADRGRFLAGTLYPDSRWVTGVPRSKTHARRYLAPDYPETDFTLGIHLHCLCDRIQGRVARDWFGRLDRLEGEALWIELSVLKMVQDMVDVQKIEMEHWLYRLGPAESPNGEAAERVGAYYDMLRQTYCGKGGLGVTPADYRALWLMVGLDAQRTDRIMDRMDAVLGAPGTRSMLAALHQATVAAYTHRDEAGIRPPGTGSRLAPLPTGAREGTL